MAQYLLSVHTAKNGSPRDMSEEEMREGFARVEELERQMRSEGALLASGRLEDVAEAAVVRASSGKPFVTDGPFIESKEALGGFYIIEAPSREAALTWGEKTSAAVGQPIEVRGFFGFRN